MADHRLRWPAWRASALSCVANAQDAFAGLVVILAKSLLSGDWTHSTAEARRGCR